MRLWPLLILGLLTATLSAQPMELTRTLKTFDFEERQRGNPEETPMNWDKVSGDGLPHYVVGKLAGDRAHDGKYSFRLDLNGGSVIYRYGPNLIPATPGGHYRVTGFTQTTALPNARARLTAFFTDQDGRPMTGTIRHSETFASTPNDNDWHGLELELTAPRLGDHQSAKTDPVATSLQIEVELLQPARYLASSLGQRALYEQDIFGSAWFDDISVAQVPRIELATGRPGNIFKQSDKLSVTVGIDDQFTQDLSGQLTIVDADEHVVFQRSGALDLSAQPGLTSQATLALPSLLPGWYRATLQMTSNGRDVGSQTCDFVRLADDGLPALADPRFGISATDLPAEGWAALPQLLSTLSAGRVKLAVWNSVGDLKTVSDRFDETIAQLQARHIDTTACLVDLPKEIDANLRAAHDAQTEAISTLGFHASDKIEPSWTQILVGNDSLWQPQLLYLLARHATHLTHWQLGPDGADDFATNPKMKLVYGKLHEQFDKLMEKPELALPWPAWYEVDNSLGAPLALHIKPEVLPSQIPLYVKDLENRPGSATHGRPAVYLQPLDAKYGRVTQRRDLVQRVIYALSAGAGGIDLPLPFTTAEPNGGMGESADTINENPQQLLPVVRTILSTLSNANYIGQVPICQGVEAFLFERQGQGIIALWSDGDAGVKTLAINLGQNPLQVDLSGNASPLLHTTAEADNNAVQLVVGPEPKFLIGVDAELAQLRASVIIDNPMLESDFKPHTRNLLFQNKSSKPIAGTVKLVPPSGWAINPPSFAFSLNPGEKFNRTIEIQFPYNSVAGTKTIEARFVTQDQGQQKFTVPLTVKLGLGEIGIQSLAARDGPDVVLQQIINNYSDKTVDYTAFAVLPGCPRQERLVANLGPGRSIVKKYRFKNVAKGEAPSLRSGVKELEGTKILNDEVPVP